MTALDQFERLETLGIWRTSAGDPGREVVVKFGKSTLVIEDRADEPLAHWSLAALRTVADDADQTSYMVDPEAPEVLSIEDPLMRSALSRILATRGARPTVPTRPRTRLWFLLPILLGMVGILLVLPATLGRLAYDMISPEKAAQIAAQMIPRIEARTGPACASEAGDRALGLLAGRLAAAGPVELHVMDLGDRPVLALPGGHVVLGRGAVERTRSEAELAGWAAIGLAEAGPGAALRAIFEDGSRLDTLWFLANGQVGEAAQERAVNRMLLNVGPLIAIDADRLEAVLKAADLPASPVVAALRREGIAAEVRGGNADGAPILSDADWIALQQICD